MTKCHKTHAEMIREAIEELGSAKPNSIMDFIRRKYPGFDVKVKSFRADIIGCSVNHTSSHHYPSMPKFLSYNIEKGTYQLNEKWLNDKTDQSKIDEKLDTALHKRVENSNELVIIDKKFIEVWSPQYDEAGIGDDYAEYDSICEQVTREVSKKTISKPTFIRILDWKAPRVKGKIKDDFEYYADGIRKALLSPEECKLAVLDDLDGIGVPVASTILHFIYPSVFPIMDVRVTEALYYSGYLKSKLRSQNNYVEYRKVIMNLVQQNKCSTRKLDRALFAYHKKELEPALKRGKKCSDHFEIVGVEASK